MSPSSIATTRPVISSEIPATGANTKTANIMCQARRSRDASRVPARAGPLAEWLSRSRLMGQAARNSGKDRAARGQARVREDFDNALRIFDGSDDLQAATTARAVFDVDIEYALEHARPTRARAGEPCA